MSTYLEKALNTKEMAIVLQKNVETVRKLCRSGEIKAWKTGNHQWFSSNIHFQTYIDEYCTNEVKNNFIKKTKEKENLFQHYRRLGIIQGE